MKIFLLVNWDNNDYARFSHVGTWQEILTPCDECNINTEILVEPLQIEWEPDSDVIGDFSWCGYTIVVLEKVKEFLSKNNFECDFGKIEVKEPTTPKKRKKMVSYPYNGPKLYWVMPNEKVNLDIEKSKLEIKKDCSKCKRKTYKFKMDGLVIPKSEWNGKNIFHINQFGFSSATYVTEVALKKIMSQNFTNFWYKEVGNID